MASIPSRPAKPGKTGGAIAPNFEQAPYYNDSLSGPSGKTTTLYVNGNITLYQRGDTISYEQLLDLLGIRANKVHTVVYTKGKDKAKGFLGPGESVEIVNLMRFNVDRTTNA